MACCNDGRSKGFLAQYEEVPVTRKFYARHDTEMTEKDKELVKRFASYLEQPTNVCSKLNEEVHDKSTNDGTTEKSKKLQKTSTNFTSCCRKGGRNNFRPDFTTKPVTPKFYARHEAKISDKVKNRAVKFREDIENRLSRDLRMIRSAPATENQIYGWLENRNIPRDPDDLAQQYYPRTSDEELKVQGQTYFEGQKEHSFVRK